MTRRPLILRVLVSATTAAAVLAPGASAMPTRDGEAPAAHHSTRMHHSQRSPALVAAAAHAATMRAIGARLAVRTCE